MDHKKYFLLVFALLPLYLQAQELGNWIMYFGQNRVHEDWSIHTEVQYRSREVSPNSEQLLNRIGLNYHLENGVMVTGGYGYILNYDAEDNHVTHREHRIWQQLILKNVVLKRIHFEHRYRVEQRWINVIETDRFYTNRLRYRLAASVPINNKGMDDNTLFFSTYNEVFLNVEKQNIFALNRLYFALGFKFNDMVSIQVGYLDQFTNKSNHRLQFGFFINPDFRKKEN